MKKMKFENFIADFETSVYEGQEKTEVWATALISLNAETDPQNVSVDNSLDAFIARLFSTPSNKKVYFVGLKFDGSFIIPWFIEHGFESWRKTSNSAMPSKSFTTLINGMGQWYKIAVHYKHMFVEFVDLCKLLPFSVEELGEGFDTKYRKLQMEYTGERHAGGGIKPEEDQYIRNDVLVPHEALKKLFELTGRDDKLTIGSLCLADFYQSFHDREEREAMLPDLTEVECPVQGFDNADAYIRKSYHGGWCYLKKGMEDTILRDGLTLDMNSLYSSMMHSSSGNVYPYGKPTWFTGEIPEKVIERSKAGQIFYFVRIRTMFDLKKGHLPAIQVKDNPVYPANDWLETSDVNGMKVYRDLDGKLKQCKVELLLTQTDFDLIKDHYDLTELEVLDGCWFYAIKGLFDEYIDKWFALKQESKGAKRTLAKLFLNNLTGKLASNTDSSYKDPYLEDGVLKNRYVEAHDKEAGYIAAGSAITSNARNFTIRHAQKNYDSFVYSDTDSLHLWCGEDALVDIAIHPSALQCWKIECKWDKAVFVRQKTYVEHTPDGYQIKCSGMGKHAKAQLEEWLETGEKTLKQFKVGLVVPHNLRTKQIKGGTVLVDSDFVLR